MRAASPPAGRSIRKGIILPIVKVAARGELNTDVFKMFMANVRAKKETAGDFRAQIAANALGARRLVEVLERFGLDSPDGFAEELFAYTEKRTREAFRQLPNGTVTAQDALDDDGHTDEPVHFKVAITIDDDLLHFDFTGTDPQRPSPMNATLTQTFAACAFVTRCLIDRDIPVNDGFFRMIKVTAPEGSAVNARRAGGCRRRLGGFAAALRPPVPGILQVPPGEGARPAARRWCATPSSAAWIPATARIMFSSRRSAEDMAADPDRMARTWFRRITRTRRTRPSKRWRSSIR